MSDVSSDMNETEIDFDASFDPSMFDVEVAEKRTDYKVLAEGSYFARRAALLDVGSHITEYNGKENTSRIFQIIFEIVPINEKKKKEGLKSNTGEKIDFPFFIGKEFNSYISDSSSFGKVLKAWNGKVLAPGSKPNIIELTQSPCTIQILTKESTKRKGVFYNVINTITQIVDGLEVEPAIQKPFFYSVKSGNKDIKFPEFIPWIMGISPSSKIKACLEFGGSGRAEFGKKKEQAATLPESSSNDDTPVENAPMNADGTPAY